MDTFVPVINVTNFSSVDRFSIACTAARSMDLFIVHSSAGVSLALYAGVEYYQYPYILDILLVPTTLCTMNEVNIPA